MKQLPETEHPIVLRSDFSDDQAWSRLCSLISSPIGRDGFLAHVSFVEDPAFAGVNPEMLCSSMAVRSQHGFIIVADSITFSDSEQPLLVMDFLNEPGRVFRALPTRIQAIENNLSIGNMGFEEFAEHVDASGIFRGFPGESAKTYEINTSPVPPRPVKRKPSPPKTLLGRALFYTYKLLRGRTGG
ncbi:DUF6924 domain-containing protein [Prosthecobacter vanneervenii]|uniref:DUF6924 domain-containing protein n=1 Tax=Prosthecobacter vanneervenii TaxID=48466 RepID=A0A7W8DN49_9BACT|nr:hypothetical protein [Prosthecobacter vanneervenii]MBB5035526.1 hypothetical protein [Prosthecobacter vanneervenii]